MIAPNLTTAGFSAREAAKQLILLEDHLACPNKQCPDCISKHKLAAEAFAEEALALDGSSKLPWLQQLPAAIRSASEQQDYRTIRKDLTAHLRDQGMAGLVGIGRLRGPGLGQAQRMLSYWMVELRPNTMDPISWASSDPARKLSLRYDSTTTQVGQHIFATQTPVNVVDMFLRQDERVHYASLIRQVPVEEAVVATSGSSAPVPEKRPSPGRPAMVLPGYIPKNPGSNYGRLSWDEKRASMAGLGCGDGSGGMKCGPSPVAQAQEFIATAEQKTGLPGWALGLIAFLLLRR